MAWLSLFFDRAVTRNLFVRLRYDADLDLVLFVRCAIAVFIFCTLKLSAPEPAQTPPRPPAKHTTIGKSNQTARPKEADLLFFLNICFLLDFRFVDRLVFVFGWMIYRNSWAAAMGANNILVTRCGVVLSFPHRMYHHSDVFVLV